MRFRVGDKVRVVSSDEDEYNAFVGVVTTIARVEESEDSQYPYSLACKDGVWWRDGELERVSETTVASGRITFDALAVCAPIVVGDKRLDEVLREYADSGEDVEIVVRRKERG